MPRITRLWKTRLMIWGRAGRFMRAGRRAVSSQSSRCHGAGSGCRGYVSYGIREKEKDWWIDSWLNYAHQKSILQYPVMTAAQNRKNGSWTDDPVFITVQDALQVLPEGEV